MIPKPYISLSILMVLKIYWVSALVIYTCVLLVLILATCIYGDGNFKKLKMVGKYQVGHREFHTTKSGLAVSCYYPMDRQEYNRRINEKGRNTRWLRYGKHSLKGLTKASANVGSREHLPEWFFTFLQRVKMYTVQDGDLAQDYAKPPKSPKQKLDQNQGFSLLETQL